MDIFQKIRKMEMVKRVNNLYLEICQETITFIFFVCPTSKERPKINRNENGFTFNYSQKSGLGYANWERIKKIQAFLSCLTDLEINFNCVCIFAAGDALIVSPIPAEKPECNFQLEGVSVVSNYGIVQSNLSRFSMLYEKRPWEKVPAKITKGEMERLFQILPNEAGKNIKIDFVERVWAGFALDGLLIKEGVFGKNPVILGVESPGVAVLQNSALERKDWLPIIQL